MNVCWQQGILLIRLYFQSLWSTYCAHTDALLTELPTKRLPWTSIAALLHNERLPLDYNRRFTVLLNKSGGSNSIRTGIMNSNSLHSQMHIRGELHLFWYKASISPVRLCA